jgi:hypothetical protein
MRWRSWRGPAAATAPAAWSYSAVQSATCRGRPRALAASAAAPICGADKPSSSAHPRPPRRGIARGLQHMLAELRGQRGQLLVESRSWALSRMATAARRRARTGVIALQQLHATRDPGAAVRAAVERIDAREQRRVEVHGILVRAQQRRHLGFDRSISSSPLELLRLKNTVARRARAAARALQRHHRVGERGRLRVVRDRVDLQALRRHARR